MSFIKMKVTSADQKIDEQGGSELFPQLVGGARCTSDPLTENGTQWAVDDDVGRRRGVHHLPGGVQVPQPYSIMFGSPKMPSSSPPNKPAMPWV